LDRRQPGNESLIQVRASQKESGRVKRSVPNRVEGVRKALAAINA
jgi:hypothetical protein